MISTKLDWIRTCTETTFSSTFLASDTLRELIQTYNIESHFHRTVRVHSMINLMGGGGGGGGGSLRFMYRWSAQLTLINTWMHLLYAPIVVWLLLFFLIIYSMHLFVSLPSPEVCHEEYCWNVSFCFFLSVRSRSRSFFLALEACIRSRDFSLSSALFSSVILRQ